MSDLASIAADMRTRALIALAALGLATTACISSSTPAVDYGTGSRFVPFVVDSTDDMGQGDAVTLTADGLPYIAYFGFPAKVAEGQIAIPRPFGAPAVPGVMLATGSSDGMWQRGAVNTIEPELQANGVSVPFGPVLTPKLDLTPANSNGTAVTIAGDGTVHVAWVMGNGVFHASTKLGGTSTVDEVYTLPGTVDQAGPIGRPGITLDADGNPWVAFTAEENGKRSVHVAHLANGKWTDEVAETAATCNGCPAPQPTGIGVVASSVVVVYADVAAGTMQAATSDGSGWTTTQVGDGEGLGLSFSTDGTTAVAASYTGAKSIEAATFDGTSWTSATVADAADPDPSVTGNLAPVTSTVIAKDGTVYVAWVDDGLHLSSGTDSFSPVDIGHTTASGAGPSLAASDNGVALSWYETQQQNLMVGFLGDLQDVLVAQPSPSLTVSQAPGGGGECGGKTEALDEVAKSLAFENGCLVAPADKPFQISFDNEDAGVLHNIAIFTDSSATDNLFTGDTVTGVVTTTYDVSALKAGTYYFHCDVHPTTMTGQIAVVKGAS